MRLHRHHWEPHPDFAAINSPERTVVRRCTRCLAVEDRYCWYRFTRSRDHLQPPRSRLRNLKPFGLYWEVKH